MVRFLMVIFLLFGVAQAESVIINPQRYQMKSTENGVYLLDTEKGFLWKNVRCEGGSIMCWQGVKFLDFAPYHIDKVFKEVNRAAKQNGVSQSVGTESLKQNFK